MPTLDEFIVNMSDNDDNDDIDTVLEHNLDDSVSVNGTTTLRQKLLSAQILGCTIIIIMTIIINNYL